jgi:hypothetical protein
MKTTTPNYSEVERLLGIATERKPRRDVVPAKKKEDFLLMDQVQASTFKDKFFGQEISAKTQSVLKSYRIKLRQAERFVLDDEAVRLICHLSHEQDRLPGWSFLARIPYPVFWVEFSGRTRVDEFLKMQKARPVDINDVAKTVGFLFYKETDSDSRWIAHEFIDAGGGEAFPSFVSYIFDPEADPQFPIRGSSTWNMPTLSMRPGFPKQQVNIVDPGGQNTIAFADPEFALCGMIKTKSGAYPANVHEDGTIEVLDSGDMLQAPEWFAARSAVIIDPFWHFHYEKSPNRLNQLAGVQLPEESGMMRWIVTMLASVNALPKAVRPMVTRPGMQRVGLAHQMPFMRHRNLTIEIPRDNRIMWARRNLDSTSRGLGRRLAWHSVRGHWRVIDSGRTRGRVCRHMPAMVDNGVGICENCEMLIRWIEVPNGRGDPELGIIDHTYKVTTKHR